MPQKRNILLYPPSVIYGAITGIRNFLYNSGVLKSHEFHIPVICVGNITVGGTGKTPHCEYLASLLGGTFKVAILSRGYKRKTRGFMIVEPGMTPDQAGDEPLQICSKFPGLTVAVDANRVRGIRNILRERPETEVIILDDGFQHRRVVPGLSVLLTDFNRLMINDHMLPYGELRENIRNMYRSDIIVVTKSPANLQPIQRRIIAREINKAAYQDLFFTSFRYGDPLPVFAGSGLLKPDLSGEKKNRQGFVLVTGIASPGSLKDFAAVKAAGMIHLSFPDHHCFTMKDIDRINSAFDSLTAEEKFIITTEKDAVRIKDFTNIAETLKSSMWYIPVEIEFLNEEKKEFDNLVTDYVRKNKRNNRIS